MAFTPIEQVRLEVGDSEPVPFQILSDEEIQYFLDKNEGSIRKASMDAAKSILFRLASLTNERVEMLEYRGSDYFKQYRDALNMYIKNSEFGSVSSAMGYAGGISLIDIDANMRDYDTNYVKVDKGVPVQFTSRNINNTSPFAEGALSDSENPFGI